MAKRKVGWPKQSNNNTGAQSGANLTGTTVSSQSCELKTSSIADCNATTTPPPTGGGSQTGAQESPSMSDIELEYHVIPPDKGKGKAVPNNTAQGGSGHDPPRERERMSRPSRRNESDDHSWSHSTRHHLTRRSDDEDIWDGLASKVKKLAESLAKAQRKTQASLSSLDQRYFKLRHIHRSLNI